MLASDFHKGFCNGYLIFPRDGTEFRKVLGNAIIDVHEADDASAGVAFQKGGHDFEGFDVLLHGVSACNADGVVTPLDRVFSAVMTVDHFRELLELFDDKSLVWNVRFDVLAIGREGDVPHPAVGREFIQMGEEWSRILCAEEKAVDHIWVQRV